MPGLTPIDGLRGVAKIFARVSPVFALLASVSLPLSSLFVDLPAQAATAPATVQRQAAVQFERAEQLRAALNVKPVSKRSLSDYRAVVSSYRRVYLITPRANEIPDALMAIAQLNTEMGERFGRTYYQAAVDAYRFLLHDYPASHHNADAMLECAKLQRDQLGDYAAATQTYQDFLKRFPKSPRKREALEGVAELALLQNSATPSSSTKASTSSAVAEMPDEPAAPSEESRSTLSAASTPSSGSASTPRIRRIRTSRNDDLTRVTIDLEGPVQYFSDRLSNPDRIFFDLRDARLPLDVARELVQVDGDLLTAVRAAQNHAGVVRVVLDVNGVKDYTVSTADNPPQLIIDLYRKALSGSAAKSAHASHNSSVKLPPAGTFEVASNAPAADNDAKPAVVSKSASKLAPKANAADNSPINNGTLKSAKSSTKGEQILAAHPTRDGSATLTRALGLKIGRIVIDAGHGGHDTGTIGPTGLMEKDLCLDVALRLGKIVKQRLPGAEVVFTRSDDSFIPLEERTAIANEAHADLFLSIHANSSQDHDARGIETYYLNLKGSPEAMEVAARENAVSQVGVHDLEDLVKKIARNDKIDESREFAEDVQTSLSLRAQSANKTIKNRGVRKAPFVVLIGADMPSILTEISFLSNPADEQLLKKPENRQKVAEGLYQGVANYLQSLNSVTVNQASTPAVKASKNASSSRVSGAQLEQSNSAPAGQLAPARNEQ
jgi:N-acetylmuramoyl-L-alanine amidase